MNPSLDASKPFTNAVHTLYVATSQFPDFPVTELMWHFFPAIRKQQWAGQASVYQNAPSSCLYTNEAGLFPWALNSHDRSFWQKSLQVFIRIMQVSPPSRFLETERARAPTEYQIKLGTRWRICRKVSCCSRLRSRNPQYCIFDSASH